MEMKPRDTRGQYKGSVRLVDRSAVIVHSQAPTCRIIFTLRNDLGALRSIIFLRYCSVQVRRFKRQHVVTRDRDSTAENHQEYL